MRPANVRVALVGACLLVACSGARSTTLPHEPTAAASFQTTPCPQPNIPGFPDLDFPPGVQCGHVTVLENRAAPDGRRIRIFVVRAPAVSATPKPDPIVYLSGGPGGAGSFEVAFMVKHGLNAERAFPDRVLRVQPKQGRLFTECPIWNVGIADPAVGSPIVSDVPVLIIEGTFDAATAPEWVDMITPNLKNVQVVPFPFTGHSVLGKSTCAPSIMTAFLDDPTKPVDQTCAARTTLTFVR